jgi:hypothetical protein
MGGRQGGLTDCGLAEGRTRASTAVTVGDLNFGPFRVRP